MDRFQLPALPGLRVRADERHVAGVGDAAAAVWAAVQRHHAAAVGGFAEEAWAGAAGCRRRC